MYPAPRVKRNDRGLVSVEFVMILPVLIMLFLVILSMGSYFLARNAAADKARIQARNLALACTPAEVANGTSKTGSATPAFTWVVPLIPAPAANPEKATYRCGG
jgi:Flp pilus assembly protein TadG